MPSLQSTRARLPQGLQGTALHPTLRSLEEPVMSQDKKEAIWTQVNMIFPTLPLQADPRRMIVIIDNKEDN